ncbi:MAG TPA: GNAT family N-acetyltransferase [Longimicrobiales bacterium]|nr:GNAT family N-acetyltransferase [Longimicrobiales bacterium]
MSAHHPPVAIAPVTEPELAQLRPQLTKLLRSTVDAGASLGFLPPLSDQLAAEYWAAVAADVAADRRILLCAFDAERVVGSAQLGFAPWPNARHRAEVQKLMVLPGYRRRGVGGALMRSIEAEARRAGRTLLVLDTRAGDAANHLYRKTGWTELGRIPGYVREPTGEHATVVYYRVLEAAGPVRTAGSGA